MYNRAMWIITHSSTQDKFSLSIRMFTLLGLQAYYEISGQFISKAGGLQVSKASLR